MPIRYIIAAVVAVLLVVVILAMRSAPKKPIVAIVTNIQYSSPVAGGPPYLTYTLTQSLTKVGLAGRSAVLKSFTPAPGQPPGASALASLLLQGLPFVPVWDPKAAVPTITTNTIPIGAPATSMSVAGQGILWFQ
jgi:hypothetical protein